MQYKNTWENPHITQINRYPMHAPYGVYESVEQALTGDCAASKYVRSLNGLWKFSAGAAFLRRYIFGGSGLLAFVRYLSGCAYVCQVQAAYSGL